jgi:hypothetical protein
LVPEYASRRLALSIGQAEAAERLSITIIVSGAKHLAAPGFFAALRMIGITGGIEWKQRTFVRYG